MFSLAIIYTAESGRPLKVADIADRGLLKRAAAEALREIDSRVDLLNQVDPVLRRIEAEEGMKLRRILMMLALPIEGERQTHLM